MHFRYASLMGALYFLAHMVFILPIAAQQVQEEEKISKVREELVKFDVREQSFDQLIDWIREQTGKNIIYDEEIKTVFVTMKLSNVPWMKALEIVAKEYKCLVEDLGQVVKISKPPTVTMEFEAADIRDIINQIATIANRNIVISEQVKGSVSLRLKDVPWQDALDAIIKTRGYVIVREKEGRILRVVPPEEIETDVETKIFKLRFIRPKSIYLAKMKSDYFDKTTEVLAKTGAGGSAIEVSRFSLLNALETVLTRNRGKITYDDATNTLVISDTKPKIDKMAEIIRELDEEPKQVFIDIKFIRTTNSDVLDFGLGTKDGLNMSLQLGSMETRLPFTLGRGGWEDAIAWEKKSVLESEGFPNDSLISPAVQPGILDMGNTVLLLKLLKKDTKSKVIQAPKIITLDHHEATIFVGRSISYADVKIQFQDNGQSTIEITESAKSPAKEGFQVLLLPHVIPGTNKVQLTVIPSNDTLTGTSTELIGFNKFAAVSGQNEVAIHLPELTQQSVVTHMILESGQTAVLGGLMKIRQTETADKIPFLGDIPLLGYFFKHKNVIKEKEDLYIFITPRIVQSAEDTQEKIKASVQGKANKNRAKYQTIWQDESLPKDTKAPETKQ